MKTEKSILQIIAFMNEAHSYVLNKKEDKLCVAIKSVQKKQINEIIDQFNEAIDDIRLDCCAVDDNNVIIRDAEKNYQFTPDGVRKMKPRIKELNQKLWNVIPQVPDDIYQLIANLSEEQRQVFAGFVLPNIDPE